MTRRERMERRLEKRQEWAGKAETRAETRYDEAHRLAHMIPLGQPILVGHHSEKRHRRHIARMDGHMSAAVEQADKARHHAGKAANLERQLAKTIFSDDADAIERLEEKVAKLDAQRKANNAANRIVRSKPKNERTPEKVAKLVALGMDEAKAIALFEPDFCGRVGIPSYVNQNLGGRITTAKKRIEEIRRQQARHEKAEEAGGVVIEGEDRYVTVTFAEKPERSVLDELKAAGFWWAKGSWYGEREKLPACVTT